MGRKKTRTFAILIQVQDGQSAPDKWDIATYLALITRWPEQPDKREEFTVADFSVYDQADLKELGQGLLQDFTESVQEGATVDPDSFTGKLIYGVK